VVDPRGYGDSSRARRGDSYSLDAYCDDLLCAADAVGLERFVIWGYSNTGALALALAGRTERAVAAACCGLDPYQDFTVWSEHINNAVDDVGEGEYLPEGRFDWRAARAFYDGYTQWQSLLTGPFRCPGVVVYGSADSTIRPSIENNRAKIKNLGFALRALPELDHQQCVEATDLVVDTVLTALPTI
jgi:pimeloyl-ACP methyl ester carboxylesterase